MTCHGALTLLMGKKTQIPELKGLNQRQIRLAKWSGAAMQVDVCVGTCV